MMNRDSQRWKLVLPLNIPSYVNITEVIEKTKLLCVCCLGLHRIDGFYQNYISQGNGENCVTPWIVYLPRLEGR